MADYEIDRLNIDVEVDDSQASDKIKKTTSDIRELGDAINNIDGKGLNETTGKMASFEAQVQESTKKVGSLNEAMSQNKGLDFTESIKVTDALRGKLDGLASKVRDVFQKEEPETPSAFSKLSQPLERVRTQYAKISQEVRNVGTYSLRSSVLARQGMQRTTNSTRSLAKELERVKNSSPFKMFGAIAKPFLSPLNLAQDALKRISKHVDSLWNRLKRVTLYRAMRAGVHMVTEGIREGINNAYEWARVMGNEFAGSMDSLATSTLYLKNSLGAMAMPLLNIVAPAVEKVIDLFVTLLNAVNKLIATLGGRSTWVKAVRYPTSYGEALDDATGSAKALEKELITILGIDEINPMEGANDSGRGSGSGGADGMDYSSMFEEVELESDRLDDFLAKMFDPFVRAWETKGKGVTDAFDNALGGLKSTAEAVGTSFWTVWTNGTGQESIEHILGILTGILNTVGNIGNRFAEGWNTDNLGTGIIQDLWDSLNDILEMWDDIANATADWADNLDFEPVIRSVKGFTEELEPLVDLITDGLSWAYTNVLLPLGKWSIEKGVPALIDTFAEALRALKNLLQIAQPAFDKLWNDFLKPLGTLTLQTTVDSLKGLKDVLKDINDIMEGKKSWSDVIGDLVAKLKDLVRVASHAGAGLNAIFKGDFTTGLNELAMARAILNEMGQAVEEVQTVVADPMSMSGMKISVTDIVDDIPEARKQEGIKGLSGWLTGEPKKESSFNPILGGLLGGLTGGLTKESGFDPNVGGLSAGITGTPKKEKGFVANIGGMIAQLGKTDTSKLSTASKTLATIANFTKATTGWAKGYLTWKSTANFTKANTGWAKDYLTWKSYANFVKAYAGWDSDYLTWSSYANFIKAYAGWDDDYLTWSAYAKFIDWWTTFGKPTIKANIQADKIITKGGATLELKALGGALYGGKWHDIPQYASGTLNAGSMFIAGEAGAELVGHVGGRTEVLNQSQLASTMYASVASANANQNRLLQEQNGLLRELINKQGNMRAYITSGDVVDGLTQRNRRDGRTVVAVGV